MGADLHEVIDSFVEAFNDNDLDRVMEFFTEDAAFVGGGRRFQGKAAIREAFEPQFRGTLGAMHFAVYDKLVDDRARKATIRWICHHDITGDNGRAIPFFKRFGWRLMFGARAGWDGLDVFHFDAGGKITGKYSYGDMLLPMLPRFQRRHARAL